MHRLKTNTNYRSDCTPFTMAGYVGEDVDQAVHRLLIAANYDVRRAETGIICLDEFDKIAKPKAIHGTKDISGEVCSTNFRMWHTSTTDC